MDALLPTHEKLLLHSGHSDTATRLAGRKLRQVRHYNKKSCVLKNRSYEVEVCGRQYRRNHRQLRMTPEVPPLVNLQESELPNPLPNQSQNLRQETNQNPEQETAEPLVARHNLSSGAHTELQVEPVEVLPGHRSQALSACMATRLLHDVIL